MKKVVQSNYLLNYYITFNLLIRRGTEFILWSVIRTVQNEVKRQKQLFSPFRTNYVQPME